MTMDYEQKYKDALERARAKYAMKDQPIHQDLVDIFPELENEDEKIRKCITLLVNGLTNEHFVRCGASLDEIKVWLEKQGEQKLYVNDNAKEMFIKALERVEEQNNKGYKLTDCDKKSWWEDFKAYISCTVEQMPTDKVEPKFKEGDWVMLDRPVLITKVEDMPYNTHQYWTSDGTWFGDATKAKLWTIQDAKDGDVLVSNDASYIVLFKRFSYSEDGIDRFKSYCHCREGVFSSIEDTGWCCNGFYPATKEQRATLIKAMADEGYTFDFDKKELKKIEKPLSEENKEHIESILKRLEGMCKAGATFTRTRFAVSEDMDFLIDLKDRILPQSTWKPSKGQIKAVEDAIEFLGCTKKVREDLKSLREQLKKLREE